MDVDAPDGYKVTEVGAVPERWEVETLGSVCDKAINGGTPSTEIEEYWEGSIPWITGADILNQKISEIRRHITEEAVRNSSTNVIPKGNLLVVTRTGVGKLAIAPFDVAVSQDFTGIIPNETVKIEFLFWLLNNSVNYFLNLTQGTSINGITRKDLMGFVFPLPPLPEQRHIAEILSTADETIERTGALIAKYRQIKAGLMTDLLTSGIDEAGRRRSEETHEFKDSPRGRVPEGWEVGLLSDIAQIDMGQSPDGDTYNSVGNGKPLLNGPVEFGAIHPIPIQWTSKPTKMCSPKDILFCVRGSTTGRMNVADQGYCIGRGIAAIRGISNIGDTSYIKYYLEREKQPIFSLASGGGSTFPNITSKDLSNLPCMCPSLPEQHRIAEILTAADDRIEKEEAYRDKLLQIKKGLMQDLLTGKVRTKAGAEA